MSEKYTIRYTSGAEVDVTADELEVTWNTSDSKVIQVTWKNMKPQPLFLGIAHIESVWEA